ncbi:MAG: substrate-binding domain-containing protein [Bryobacteraceae bacterium]|nr:substrate-binding domain-containing protein [Bryobacteraceae bacterium]MDW8379393.1 substrate-binding domain-containing protein [Bryobacterales bacterium]
MSDYVEAVLRACEILRCFAGLGGDSNAILRVQDIADRTGLHKATVSRLLKTLEVAGFLERLGRRGYRSQLRLTARRLRLGYASQTQRSLFAQTVTESIENAARAQNVELITFDNRYDPETTLRNAERMIAERVDVAIEFQTFEKLAQTLAAMYQQARIPVIFVDLPAPGAIYFGANNYEAGRLAGRAAARWVQQHWKQLDEVLLIELADGGALLESRMAGALAGLNSFRNWPARVIRLDGRNTFEGAQDAVRRYLRKSKAKQIAVLAMNDPNALGALEAFRSAGREQHCIVVGQGATVDARQELRQPASRLIGTVAYFPERYGDGLIRLALDVLQKKKVPPAVYTRHRIVTSTNVDHIYAEDCKRQGLAVRRIR